MLFTTTRNLAERLTWALKRRFPDRQDEIAVHHSAISAARRRVVERRLKHGRLWAVVTSTSLELGIDVGAVDQVVFVHPPGGVVRLLQRVGRSGHRPDEPRRGLLLTASPGELLEAIVTASSGRDNQIEHVRACDAPLDVVCQQIVGLALTDHWLPAEAFALIRRASPFQHLAWDDFQQCLDYLSGQRRDGTSWLPARLRWADGRFTIADDRTARLMRRNLGTILTEDACAIRLRDPMETDEKQTTPLGEVDQAYAERLQPGDRFVLDGRCVELKKRQASALLVEEVFGRPQAPRWLGAGMPMPNALARRIFLFRMEAGETLRDGDAALQHWLRTEYHLDDAARRALTRYLQEQETISEIPTLPGLLIEAVAMQSCHEYFVHTPLPRSANDAVACLLLQRWRHGPWKGTLAIAADLGIYLLAPTVQSLTADDWRRALAVERMTDDLREHLQGSALLAQSFARVAQTGLMVLRNPLGRKRKVGGKDWSERRLFEQLRATTPDFVLLHQAGREVLQGSCDIAAAQEFITLLASGPIRVRFLREPSPFGRTLMGDGYQTAANANSAREAS
jgi:ATP-dependent Lhr-like helicase